MKRFASLLRQAAKECRRPPGTCEAAIMLPIVMDSEPCVLLEVRAGGLRLHGGEVCLPGGFLNNTEDSWQCAKRETEEEVGLKVKDENIIGDLGVWWNRKSKVKVIPWVMFNEQPFNMAELTINKDEVDHVFLARISDLLNPIKREYRHLHKGWPPVPFFHPDGHHVIWGFTGFVLAGYLDKLGPLLDHR